MSMVTSGFLSRSTSLNNLSLKSKFKKLTGSILVKPIMTRESSFNDARKDVLRKSLTKSASFKSSFKSIGARRSNAELAGKIQFIHQSRVEEPRSLKLAKGTNPIAKKNSSILERPLAHSSPKIGTVSPFSKTDLRTASNDVKLNNATQSNILGVNKGSDDANGSGKHLWKFVFG